MSAEIMPARCTAEEARMGFDRLKVGLEGMWQLVVHLYTTRAWEALGYGSWDEACTRELGTSHLRLPREEREQVVASLRDAGLSLRAISAATGVNERTVRRTISGAAFAASDPEPVALSNLDTEHELAERVAAELAASDGEYAKAARTIGTDGKSYPSTKLDRGPEATAKREALARELAGTGHRSEQIASKLGMTHRSLKELCRRVGITIVADETVRRSRRLNANRVIEATVRSAESSPELLKAINFADLDRALIGEWVSSLSESIRALRSLKTILEKELTHVGE
jgi:transposase-like protein